MKSLLFLSLVALMISALPAQEGARPAPADVYAARVRPFLETHCLECHRGDKPKGEFRLDHLDPGFTSKTAEERWRTVLEQLKAGAMPPKKKTRPPEPETRTVTDWIDSRLAAVEA